MKTGSNNPRPDTADFTEEERQLTVEYYSGEDKNVIAQRNGITLSALYSRIRNIKQKLRKLL